jgi:uncharacterized surface protein with fasciclin (FAS1) repeats
MRVEFVLTLVIAALISNGCRPAGRTIDRSQQANAGVNIVAAAILASEKQLPDTTQPADDSRPDLVQVISESQQSHQLVLRALRVAGLIPELQKAGPYTLLLPTDGAFDKFPPGTFDRLLEPQNREKLRALLLYHMLSGRIPLKDMRDTNGQVAALSGAKVVIRGIDDKVMVNDVNVLRAENAASNGVIYWLDGVLLPPAS